MKYFSAQKIALFLSVALSVSKVQCSQLVAGQELDYSNDPCLVKEFGRKPNHAAMLVAVNTADIPKVIDAFINCPFEMSYIYFDKISLEGSAAIVSGIKDSGKIKEFYAAFRSLPPLLNSQPIPMDAVRREVTRQTILGESFVQDIPEEHFLDLLKTNRIMYITSMIDKSMACDTPESKAWISNLLKDEIALMEDTNQEYPFPAERPVLSEMIRMVIKMVDGEPLIVEEITPQSRTSIFFISLGFNRLDLARALINGVTFDAKSAAIFFAGKYAKHVIDMPKTVQFLNSLLANKAEKDAFAHFCSNRPELSGIAM